MEVFSGVNHCGWLGHPAIFLLMLLLQQPSGGPGMSGSGHGRGRGGVGWGGGNRGAEGDTLLDSLGAVPGSLRHSCIWVRTRVGQGPLCPTPSQEQPALYALSRQVSSDPRAAQNREKGHSVGWPEGTRRGGVCC